MLSLSDNIKSDWCYRDIQLYFKISRLLALLCVMFSYVFVTFSCGVMGQVWYLIISISYLCLLSYFY